MYYILCIERTAHHKQLFWWMPNREGYTTILDRAGKYDFKEMTKIIKDSAIGGTVGDIAIGCKTLLGDNEVEVSHDGTHWIALPEGMFAADFMRSREKQR